MDRDGNILSEDFGRLVGGSMQEIKLPNFNVNDAQILALSRNWMNRQLVAVDLSNNDLGDEGCVQLSEALLSVSTLRSLNLSHNFIDDPGGEALCRLLNSKNIISLDVSHNLLRDRAAWAFSQALSNGAIIKLDLSANIIGRLGAKAIFDALKENSSPQTRVILDKNPIRHDFFSTFSNLPHFQASDAHQTSKAGFGEGATGDAAAEKNALDYPLRLKSVSLWALQKLEAGISSDDPDTVLAVLKGVQSLAADCKSSFRNVKLQMQRDLHLVSTAWRSKVEDLRQSKKLVQTRLEKELQQQLKRQSDESRQLSDNLRKCTLEAELWKRKASQVVSNFNAAKAAVAQDMDDIDQEVDLLLLNQRELLEMHQETLRLLVQERSQSDKLRGTLVDAQRFFSRQMEQVQEQARQTEDDLRQQLDHLRDPANSPQVEIALLHEKLAAHEKERGLLRQTEDDLEDEVARLQAAVKELEEELGAERSHGNDLDIARLAGEAQLEKLQMHDRTRQMFLEQQTERYTEQIHSLEQQLAHAHADVDALRASSTSLESQLRDAQQKSDQLGPRCDMLHEKKQKVQAENMHLRERVDALEKNLHNAEAQLRASLGELAEARLKLDGEAQRAAELLADKAKAEADSRPVSEERDRLRIDARSLQERLDAAEKSLQEREGELAQSKAACMQAEAKVLVLQADVAQLQHSLEEARQGMATRDIALADLDKRHHEEAEAFRIRLAKAAEFLNDSAKAAWERQVEIQKLNAEPTNVAFDSMLLLDKNRTQKLDQLERALARNDESCRAAAAEAEQLRVELVRVQSQLEHKTREAESCKQQVETLKRELKEKEDSFASSRGQDLARARQDKKLVEDAKDALHQRLLAANEQLLLAQADAHLHSQRVKALEADLDSLRAQIANLQKEIDGGMGAKLEQQRLSTQVAQLKTDLQAKSAECARLTQANEGMRKRIEETSDLQRSQLQQAKAFLAVQRQFDKINFGNKRKTKGVAVCVNDSQGLVWTSPDGKSSQVSLDYIVHAVKGKATEVLAAQQVDSRLAFSIVCMNPLRSLDLIANDEAVASTFVSSLLTLIAARRSQNSPSPSSSPDAAAIPPAAESLAAAP